MCAGTQLREGWRPARRRRTRSLLIYTTSRGVLAAGEWEASARRTAWESVRTTGAGSGASAVLGDITNMADKKKFAREF